MLGEISRAIHEMTNGKGVATFDNVVTDDDCNVIKRIIESYEPDKYGSVRCILDKSERLREILSSDLMLGICSELFKVEFRLSSLGARVIPPDGNNDPEHYHVLHPHIDHPYREIINGNPGKQSIYYGIPLGLQVLLPLVDLDENNGATAYVPGSQNWYAPVSYESGFDRHPLERLCVKRGSLNMWSGPLWHSARPNQSQENRVVITALYSPAFMKHPHLNRGTYSDEFLEGLPENLKALLGLNDPYPMTFEQPKKLDVAK